MRRCRTIGGSVALGIRPVGMVTAVVRRRRVGARRIGLPGLDVVLCRGIVRFRLRVGVTGAAVVVAAGAIGMAAIAIVLTGVGIVLVRATLAARRVVVGSRRVVVTVSTTVAIRLAGRIAVIVRVILAVGSVAAGATGTNVAVGPPL